MTPTPEQTRKCSNCMWWVNPASDGYATIGECRGAIPNQPTDGKIGVWPRTYDTSFCGSFRIKERFAIEVEGVLSADQLKVIRTIPHMSFSKKLCPDNPKGRSITVSGGFGAGSYEADSVLDCGDWWHVVLRAKEPAPSPAPPFQPGVWS